ncbi:MAG: DUF484 family protein [Halioglobus sp.]
MAGKNDSAIKSTESTINDEMVRDYLIENNDFLQRNPEMLDHLHISHASGSAISLVEKQVGILRERNIEMRRRLNTLTANARDNDKLYEQTRSLVLALLAANSCADMQRAFVDSMKNDFQAEYASMILFGDPENGDRNTRMESAENAKAEIGALLKGRKAVCGALRKEELSYLFPKSGDIGSAALMPLSNGKELGIIAVGSSDANRYNSSMGTLFLTHIADVMVRLLPRFTEQ